MSQNLPPNNNSAQKDDDFEVNFDFLDENTDSTPKKSIGDELDDLSFLNSLDDSTSISAPPPTSPNKQGANDGFDDFFSSLDNDPIDEVKPAKSQLDDELVAAAPMAKKPSSKFKDKETAAKPKKSLFSFGKKGDDKKTDDKKVAPAKPKKSLFSFGKKDATKPADKPKKSAFGADKKADAKPTDKPKKSLFSFGKKDATKPADKPKKSGGLGFGKKDDVKAVDKAAKPVAGKPATGGKAAKAPTNKKTLWLALGALLAVALLFMAWTMMNSEEPAPPPPAKVAPPKPKTPPPANPATVPAPDGQVGQAPAGQPAGQVPAVQPVQPVPTGQPAAAGQNTGAATANNAQAGANAGKNAPLVTGAPAIDADAIVKAEVPQDPALIKEEIDRLNDKNGQFQEQAKIIDEQLGKLEELTVAKEEKIALLEAQIAQLEAQKKK